MEKNQQKNLSLKGRFSDSSSCPGSNLASVYQRVYDNRKHVSLVKQVKKVDAYKERQGYVSACDYEIAKKQILAGQIPVDNSDLFFGDLSVMPKNIHDAFDILNKAGESFDKLPVYLKKAFGSIDGYTKAIRENKAEQIISSSFKKEAIRQLEASKTKTKTKDGE